MEANKDIYVIQVKHSPNDKAYTFNVPMKLIPVLKRNMCVTVKTRIGKSSGVTVSEIISGEAANEVIKVSGASLPLKSVVSLFRRIPLDSVIISDEFAKTHPRSDTLMNCYEHYRKYKKFNGHIVVDENGVLIDGYTRYLVAKMFGHKNIRVIAMAI